MVPVEQTCPKCKARFMGSDMVGDPCPSCQFGWNYMSALNEAINQMSYEEKDEADDTTTD